MTNEEILDKARELYNTGEITQEQLYDTYFHQFIKPRITKLDY